MTDSESLTKKKQIRWPTHIENIRLDCIALLLDIEDIQEQLNALLSSYSYDQKEAERLINLIRKKNARTIELLESVRPKQPDANH